MSGWLISRPSEPVKSGEHLLREREAKIAELQRRGLLRSEQLRTAMLTVRREEFIPPRYRDHAYEEVPLPLPGERAAISCPHSYPLFYEPLGLGERERFLEIGVGSGYGTALAREVVDPEGLVVAVDLDATTLAFARERLEDAGYTDVVLVHGDGGLGYPTHASYERICVTAACPEIPPPLIEQLATPGRLIAPVLEGTRQRLTFLERARTASTAGSWPTSCTCRCGDGAALASIPPLTIAPGSSRRAAAKQPCQSVPRVLNRRRRAGQGEQPARSAACPSTR